MQFMGFKTFIQIRQGLKLAKENNNRFKREKGQKFPLVHGIMLFWPSHADLNSSCLQPKVWMNE